MVYVALSRVTSLDGLHLIALDKSKITCDKKALEEYNRLRRKFAPHLGEIPATASAQTIDLHTVTRPEHQPESRTAKRKKLQKSDAGKEKRLKTTTKYIPDVADSSSTSHSGGVSVSAGSAKHNNYCGLNIHCKSRDSSRLVTSFNLYECQKLPVCQKSSKTRY